MRCAEAQCPFSHLPFSYREKKIPVLFVSTDHVHTGQSFGRSFILLRQDSTDVPDTVSPLMDEEEEMAAQFMADKDDEPSQADQPLANSSEEQPSSSTTEEKLQSEQRKRVQLES